MTINEISRMLETPAYAFLRDNEHLGRNIIFLTLGGSYAYGTNVEGSDVDIRGCALNRKEEILTGQNFEQFVNADTDTTIYSFNKLVKLLLNCNPNTIEELGCRPEHYFYVSEIGQEMLDNRDMFLSKRCTYTFGSYAYSQLRRLDNKAVRTVEQEAREQHILNSIHNASHSYSERFLEMPDDAIRLYIDKSDQEEYDSEIFMDVHLIHYPLRDYKGMWSDMNNIVKDYAKIGRRNSRAAEHGKLAKHMMHLIRLYLMCMDILDNGEIVTYREKDLPLLMSIRNGDYLDENDQPIPSFFELVETLQADMQSAAERSDLPDKPDMNRINRFVMSVNERVVRGEC